MRLDLGRLDGLRVSLSPGWYELPSHLDPAEQRRLLGLLAAAVGCRHVVECAWSELVLLRGGEVRAALVHVTVPATLSPEARDAVLGELTPRLGLFTSAAPGRWPERTWDELEVKSALATWLRKSLRSEEHPLAGLGIATLPIDELIAATCEPIELLVLVETTIEFASRERARDGGIDWRRCIDWSVGRRLAARLHRAAPRLRGALARAIVASPEGPLPPLTEPNVLGELARLGLAHVAFGDAVLVPLARAAAEARVQGLLELEGVYEAVPSTPSRVRRERARNPKEAAEAFSSRVEIGPEDPWFVDLRPLSSPVRQFCEHFDGLLGRDRKHARVAVIQRPESGADTTIRRLLFEARSRGVIAVAVRAPPAVPSDELHFADLLLAALGSLLEWCDAEHGPPLSIVLLERLRRRLVDIALDGEDRDYFVLGAGLVEEISLASLIMLIRGLADVDRGEPVTRRLLGGSQEILELLSALVDAIQEQLSERGARLCLRFEGLDTLVDPTRIDELVLARGAEFERIPCDMVFSLHLVAEYFPATKRASEVFSILVYTEAPNSGEVQDEEARAITRALLAARAELVMIFDDVEARVEEIAAACGGVPRYIFCLTLRACQQAEEVSVSTEHIEKALGLIAGELTSAIPDGRWFSVESPLGEGQPREPEILQTGLYMPKSGGGWAIHPLIRHDSRLGAARLRRLGLEARSLGDFERAEADLTRSLALLAEDSIAATTCPLERISSLVALGSVYHKCGRLKDAERVFSEALEEARAHDSAKSAVSFLAWMYAGVRTRLYGAGAALEAATTAWEARDIGDGVESVSAGVLYAQSLLASGRQEAAIEVVVALMKQFPKECERARALLESRIKANSESE